MKIFGQSITNHLETFLHIAYVSAQGEVTVTNSLLDSFLRFLQENIVFVAIVFSSLLIVSYVIISKLLSYWNNSQVIKT